MATDSPTQQNRNPHSTRLARRSPAACRHCGGSGREPAPLKIDFSRSGSLRGVQQKIADATGLSAPMLSMIFAGERTPSVTTLLKLARYFRTTVDQVLRVPAIWKRVRESEKNEKNDAE